MAVQRVRAETEVHAGRGGHDGRYDGQRRGFAAACAVSSENAVRPRIDDRRSPRAAAGTDRRAARTRRRRVLCAEWILCGRRQHSGG